MSSPYTPGERSLDGAVSGAHADYHREIQQHTEPDGLVDDVVTYRMLAPHLMRTLLFLVAPTVLLLLKFVIDYLASMSSPDAFTDVVSTLLGFLVVVLYLAGIASFFAPAKEPIAEHARLLENRGDAAEAALEYVRRAADARRSPAEVRPSTVAGVPVLLFSQYSERAMLLVQPYGRDLYVGWTMWRSRSTATLLLHFLRDTFGRFAPSPRFSAELRAAATRALRESVHSLAREGVAAALHAGDRPVPPGAHGGDGHGAGFRDGGYDTRSGPIPAPTPGATRSTATGPGTGGRAHEPHPHGQPQHPQGQHLRQPHAPEAPGREEPAAERREEPHSSGALPAAGPPADQQGVWTGGTADRTRAGERVGVRRDTDDGWGPPPRDRG